MAKELPGFYFDERDNRYHKILPDHLAPKGSKYTQQAIKNEKEDRQVNRCFILSSAITCHFLLDPSTISTMSEELPVDIRL